MKRLHGGDHIELCKPRRITRMNDLHMFDAMTQVREMILGFIDAQLFIGVEYFMIGAVTNRVDGQSESNLRGFASVFKELLTIHVQDAAVLTFTDIGFEHRGGVWAKRAIHEHFDVANTKHVITEAVTQSKLIGLVEQFNGKILKHAQFEFIFRTELLQSHERIAAIKVMDTG